MLKISRKASTQASYHSISRTRDTVRATAREDFRKMMSQAPAQEGNAILFIKKRLVLGQLWKRNQEENQE